MEKFSNSKAKLEKLKETKLFVLDMDGTIYIGKNVIKGAIEFCEKILSSGKKLIYFTNNASRNPDDYVLRLKNMGFPCSRDMVVTSGDVTVAYLKEHYNGKSVYLLGTPALHKSFADAGIEFSENSDIVVSSFDLTLTYEKLEKACTLIRNGAKFFSTHPDINCPTEDGYIPDSGAICAAITASTGVKPRYFGKPYAETVESIELISGVSRENSVMVGDRLYTDIALGKNNGMTTILVMSGETDFEMLACAEPDQQPDLVFSSVAEIEF